MPRADLEPLYTLLRAVPPATSIPELRERFDAMAFQMNAGAPAMAQVERVPLDGALAVDVLVPRGTPPFPVLVYLHGGGWSIGSTATHAKLARELAAGAGVVVVNVDYRLAPERPFPGPLDDAVAAVRWTVREIARFGGDGARLAIGGDSAGGNLAAAAIAAMAPALPVCAALLFYGAFDLATLLDEHARRAPDGTDPILPYDATKMMLDAYLAGGADPHDPRLSPLRGPLEAFPPSCLLVGTDDPIRDQTFRMHAALRATGRPADLHTWDEMSHAFVQFAGLAEAHAAIATACAFLRDRLRTA